MNRLRDFFAKRAAAGGKDRDAEGDEFKISSEAPEPQNAYFKSAPIKIAIAGLVIFAAFAVLMGNIKKSAKREELKSSNQSEYYDRSQAAKKNISSAPDSYSILAKLKAEEEQQKQRKAQEADSMASEKPVMPTPPEVPRQPEAAGRSSEQELILKSKEAANNSPILFKVNK